jgi:hypothetical protein
MDEKTFTITEEEVYNYEDDIAERW